MFFCFPPARPILWMSSFCRSAVKLSWDRKKTTPRWETNDVRYDMLLVGMQEWATYSSRQALGEVPRSLVLEARTPS